MPCDLLAIPGDLVLASQATAASSSSATAVECVDPCAAEFRYQPFISFQSKEDSNSTLFKTVQNFLWPVESGIITLGVPNTGLYQVGQGVFVLPSYGWLTITDIPNSTTLVLTNPGSVFNSPGGTLVPSGTWAVVGVPEKPDLDPATIAAAVEAELEAILGDSIDDALAALIQAAGPPIWPATDVLQAITGRIPLWDFSGAEPRLKVQSPPAKTGNVFSLVAFQRDGTGTYHRFDALDPIGNEAGELLIIRKDGANSDPKPYVASVAAWIPGSEVPPKLLCYVEEGYTDPETGAPRIRKKWRTLPSPLALPVDWIPAGSIASEGDADGAEILFVKRVSTPLGDRLYPATLAPADGQVVVGFEGNWRTAASGLKFTQDARILFAGSPEAVGLSANNAILKSATLAITGVPAGSTHAQIRFRIVFLCPKQAASSVEDSLFCPSAQLEVNSQVIAEAFSCQEAGSPSMRNVAFPSAAGASMNVPLVSGNTFSYQVKYKVNEYSNATGGTGRLAVFVDLEGFYGPLIS